MKGWMIRNTEFPEQMRGPKSKWNGKFVDERAAKAAATRMSKKLNEKWEAVYWEPKMVTKTNLLTGEEFQISEDTPLCCDPSSETYWSS